MAQRKRQAAGVSRAGRTRAVTRSSARGGVDEVATIVNGVRRLDRGLRLVAREVEKRAGISAAQLFVLERLADAPAASLSELADATLTDRSSVSTVVERLVSGGLVTRTASASDLRRLETRITAAGRRVLRRAPSPPAARLIAAVKRLPARRRTQLAEGLAALTGLMGLDAERPRLLFEDGKARAPRR